MQSSGCLSPQGPYLCGVPAPMTVAGTQGKPLHAAFGTQMVFAKVVGRVCDGKWVGRYCVALWPQLEKAIVEA